MVTIKIGDVTVDPSDPCAMYEALYLAKVKLLAGGRIEETEVQSPATRRRLRVSAASIADIDRELVELRNACERKTTGRPARSARRIRFTAR